METGLTNLFARNAAGAQGPGTSADSESVALDTDSDGWARVYHAVELSHFDDKAGEPFGQAAKMLANELPPKNAPGLSPAKDDMLLPDENDVGFTSDVNGIRNAQPNEGRRQIDANMVPEETYTPLGPNVRSSEERPTAVSERAATPARAWAPDAGGVTAAHGRVTNGHADIAMSAVAEDATGSARNPLFLPVSPALRPVWHVPNGAAETSQYRFQAQLPENALHNPSSKPPLVAEQTIHVNCGPIRMHSAPVRWNARSEFEVELSNRSLVPNRTSPDQTSQATDVKMAPDHPLLRPDRGVGKVDAEGAITGRSGVGQPPALPLKNPTKNTTRLIENGVDSPLVARPETRVVHGSQPSHSPNVGVAWHSMFMASAAPIDVNRVKSRGVSIAAVVPAVSPAYQNAWPSTPLQVVGGDFLERSGATSIMQTLAPGPTGKENAMAVIHQITAQLNAAASDEIEIMLNPKELGSVRMILSPTENGMVLSMTMERTETHDLIRRHIDLAEKTFRDLGFSDLSIDLSLGQHHPPHRADVRDSADGIQVGEARPDTPKGKTLSKATITSAGLDIRV
ncbi:flagellar hook-length control protein FliK [Primorskyibacter aestuariivivens]|uniref:flagellar hook-length control protein FliK n=1 Tax=Primorskyibacter aestuariivivens TaxID=1888912 RepID=UPI0023007FDE|nr:flagellar hook-length control protein FliK [Primorskyibacter aestuariivivens]MDA7430211.1 flagellar hook-length control protein FliK [Primorskyibacter aestuariivivens]